MIVFFFNQGRRVSFNYYLSIDKPPDCHANTACCFIVTDVFIIVWKETLNHVVFINFIKSINLHAPVIFKSNASFKVDTVTGRYEGFGARNQCTGEVPQAACAHR